MNKISGTFEDIYGLDKKKSGQFVVTVINVMSSVAHSNHIDVFMQRSQATQQSHATQKLQQHQHTKYQQQQQQQQKTASVVTINEQNLKYT